MKLFNSKLLASLIAVSAFSMSSASFATIVSVGDLNYDTDTQIISGNGKDYLGFGVGRTWDYATTLAMTSSTGEYSDFSIATTSDADFFIGSLFGSSADACSKTDGRATSNSCGTSSYSDDIFGVTGWDHTDLIWFLADESLKYDAGYIAFTSSSIDQYDAYTSFATTDAFNNIGWLIVRDTATVPEPSILMLMGLGIFGLGLARRKIKK